MLSEGDLIAGRYRLDKHLGDGGSASVWKASDLTLDRAVAVKFLYAADERYRQEQTEQFLREARLACSVQHRNVIHTMDFGETDGGQAYMVMELLEGKDLSERMVEEQALCMEEVVQIMSLSLRGLHAVHKAEIVHRDLKPENIYLEEDGDGLFPKIIDFGISRSTRQRKGSSRRSVLTTKEGVVVGTPEYMSPEQARGVPDLDLRTDIWSMGVVLYELLAFKLPFEHPNPGDLIIQIATTDAPDLLEARPDVGRPIADVVKKALSRERADRYQDAAQMQQALLDAARESMGSVRSSPSHASPAAGSPRRGGPVLWASLTALAIVAGALFVTTPRPTPQAATEATGPVKAAQPSTVSVTLEGLPADALVQIDGKPATGPQLELPNDGHARLIQVNAPGKLAWRVVHPAGDNAHYRVRMQAAATLASPVVAETAKADGAVRDSRPRQRQRRTGRPRPRTGKKKPAVWRQVDF